MSHQLKGLGQVGAAGQTYPPPAAHPLSGREGSESGQLDDSEMSSEGDVAALFAQMRSKIANKELTDSEDDEAAAHPKRQGRKEDAGHRR